MLCISDSLFARIQDDCSLSVQSWVWAADSVRQSWILYVLDWDWDVKKVSVSTGKYWQWDRANWVTVIVDDRDERERARHRGLFVESANYQIEVKDSEATR